MSWRKHFRVINPTMPAMVDEKASAGTSSKYPSYLPEVYAGNPSRIQRYYQYQDMGSDPDICAALDTIADFCTQSEEQNDEPFQVVYKDDANETEVTLVKANLEKWIKLNNFKQRLWYIFRSTIMNGDFFALRDPETAEWLWVDHFSVEMVKVDETKGKEPDEYIIRGLDINRQAKFATKIADPSQYRTQFGTSLVPGSRPQGVQPGAGATTTNNVFQLAGAGRDPRTMAAGQTLNQLSVVDADHMIHLSMSVGMDINWPFGSSILEPIFKIFKQKELLEDSIIIYRVMRAPERRVFYIDVGTMPPIRARSHIEQIKNEIHQRRIPTRNGGGSSALDAAYNPLCVALDTKIPLTDGRTLNIIELAKEYQAGKENWAYSCDLTGKIMPGIISWAGITRKNTKVIRLVLSNKKELVCTPDHKIPVLGKGFIEAQYLTSNDELIGTNDENIRLVYIEKLTNTIDTGTVTIDREEKYHGNHTFLTDAKIFIKNSIIDDYFFAQCTSLNTKIPLLDGRILTLQDIIFEHEAGKINYVYSLNKITHELEAGKITWAGVTRKNAQLIRVTLDNNEYIDATPDHKFVMRDGAEVEARYLKPNDSLMPLYLQKGMSGPNQKGKGYLRYKSNTKGSKTKFVHGVIQPKPLGKEYVVHHVDFNSFNNNPDNLVVMSWEDHEKLHKETGAYSLNKQWNSKKGREKLLKGIRKLYDEASSEFMEKLSERNKINGKKTWEKDSAEQTRQTLIKNSKICSEQRTIKYSEIMFKRVVELYDNYDSLSKLIPILKKDKIFQSEFKNINKNTKRASNDGEIGCSITDRTIKKVIQIGGYSSWQEFKETYQYNHKVISVELLPNREDTGDITIDNPSHWFALAAGVYVHNSSEGRGSKVEVLPGGDNLGEIGDLTFFTKKMARGLRIPTSYLSLGDDDGSGGASYNDGKLGAAVIQEFRFSKYCMRLQNLLTPTFDKDFKRFLRDNGVEIESDLFELQFNPPQNFTKYRQIELDAQQVSVYTNLADNKRLSERFKLKRFLNLTEDEILENERLWAEENAARLESATGTNPADDSMGSDLGSVGIHAGGGMGDMGFDDMEMPAEGEGELGGEQPMAGGPGGGAGGPPSPPPVGGEGPPL